MAHVNAVGAWSTGHAGDQAAPLVLSETSHPKHRRRGGDVGARRRQAWMPPSAHTSIDMQRSLPAGSALPYACPPRGAEQERRESRPRSAVPRHRSAWPSPRHGPSSVSLPPPHRTVRRPVLEMSDADVAQLRARGIRGRTAVFALQVASAPGAARAPC
jgi:hypothetical protein